MSSSDSDTSSAESDTDAPELAVTARPDEEVLSLDLEKDDYLYRIRKKNRIVYVHVLNGDAIPPDYRTDSYRILLHLRKVPRWEEEWTTLTVRRGAHGLESTLNEFKPHGLNLAKLDVSSAKFYNLSDLTRVSRISDRMFCVKGDNEIWVMKIASFKHEVRYLQQEVAIYSKLASAGFPLAPRLIGYVYEETKDRTMGFLMEKISGYPPSIDDLEACTKTIRLLHTFGILHGDTNRYNFLMTEKGAQIFDFEGSVALEDKGSEAALKEVEGLEAHLLESSGRGQKWFF
ncbi:uncharacterized protein BO97DRAFT_433945 [Aspergillus homomorphus CBS 101889]|uniref:non-specific serine/threonine protein kinase n=1 Tax=Aspergillus homomorphus (strain CBS 101889) TaxID=1450537 RepID=A0A395HZ95_ASPHC|nr:hypothetical protein BO97DRAFT_433945 [Aspergillus homomorphus CBS 101889]RAL13241.1 hypothetical protein BO97DRAFT_433945 [Aspergillus homomorphus CBS 101889]